MSASVDSFDIPDSGSADRCSDSKLQGFVIVIDKCTDHEHWLKITSLGWSEFISTGYTKVASGTDMIIDCGADKTETVTGNKTESVGADKTETVTGNKTETSDIKYIMTNDGIYINGVDSSLADTAPECFDGDLLCVNKYIEWSIKKIGSLV